MAFEARLQAAGVEGLSEFQGGPAMIAIQSGRFVMGSPGEVLTERSWWEVELPKLHEPDGIPEFFTPMEWEEVRGRGPYNERPQREVAVPAFALGKYLVTFEEWDACAADGFCRPVPDAGASKGDKGWGRGRRPVINISWNDVTGADGETKGFLRWLNWKAVGDENASLYRLPTEAEWEFAARAGSETFYHFGDDESMLGDYAWHVLNKKRETRPVGEKKPNRWGLYDIYGNVGEWVQDCWRHNYVGAPSDGSVAWMDADVGRRSCGVTRGHPAFPGGMGSAARGSMGRDRRMDSLGFRVARSLLSSTV